MQFRTERVYEKISKQKNYPKFPYKLKSTHKYFYEKGNYPDIHCHLP